MNYCPECAAQLVHRDVDGKMRLACPNCTFVHWENPVPVVAGVILRKGKLLLVRTNYMPEGRMGLPAGYIEKEESAEEALKREVMEELGLELEVKELIGTYPITRPEKNLLYIAYEGEARDSEVTPGSEISNVFFLDPEEALSNLKGTTAGKALSDWFKNFSDSRFPAQV